MNGSDMLQRLATGAVVRQHGITTLLTSAPAGRFTPQLTPSIGILSGAAPLPALDGQVDPPAAENPQPDG